MLPAASAERMWETVVLPPLPELGKQPYDPVQGWQTHARYITRLPCSATTVGEGGGISARPSSTASMIVQNSD
jgi:hypothetical protein